LRGSYNQNGTGIGPIGGGGVQVEWVNQQHPHSGRYGYGKTPGQTFHERKKLALEKQLNHQHKPFIGQFAGGQPPVRSHTLSD
jgi:hypothetical protein